MVMQFVQIVEQESNVEMAGLRTLKNAIDQVKPVKMLEKNATRTRGRRTQTYLTISKGQKYLNG